MVNRPEGMVDDVKYSVRDLLRIAFTYNQTETESIQYRLYNNGAGIMFRLACEMVAVPPETVMDTARAMRRHGIMPRDITNNDAERLKQYFSAEQIWDLELWIAANM